VTGMVFLRYCSVCKIDNVYINEREAYALDGGRQGYCLSRTCSQNRAAVEWNHSGTMWVPAGAFQALKEGSLTLIEQEIETVSATVIQPPPSTELIPSQKPYSAVNCVAVPLVSEENDACDSCRLWVTQPKLNSDSGTGADEDLKKDLAGVPDRESFGVFCRMEDDDWEKPFRNAMRIHVLDSTLTLSFRPRKRPMVTHTLPIHRLKEEDTFEVHWHEIYPQWPKCATFRNFVSNGNAGLLEDGSKFWLRVPVGCEPFESGACHSSSSSRGRQTQMTTRVHRMEMSDRWDDFKQQPRDNVGQVLVGEDLVRSRSPHQKR